MSIARFGTLACLSLVLGSTPASAQPAAVEQYVREHQPAILRELLELVSVPNVKNDRPNIRRNADVLRQMLDRRGLKPEIWDTPSTPVVFGERTLRPQKSTRPT